MASDQATAESDRAAVEAAQGCAAMRFIRLPGLKMVASREETKPRHGRRFAELDQMRHGELLVRKHKSDNPLPGKFALPCTPLLIGLGEG